MTRIDRFAERRVRVMSLNPAVEPSVWVARGSLAAGMCAESPEGANQAGCVQAFHDVFSSLLPRLASRASTSKVKP